MTILHVSSMERDQGRTSPTLPHFFITVMGRNSGRLLRCGPCLKNDSSLQVIMPSEKLSIVEGLLRQVAPPDTCNASLCERTAAAVDAWFAQFSSFFPSRLSTRLL